MSLTEMQRARMYALEADAMMMALDAGHLTEHHRPGLPLTAKTKRDLQAAREAIDGVLEKEPA